MTEEHQRAEELLLKAKWALRGVYENNRVPQSLREMAYDMVKEIETETLKK